MRLISISAVWVSGISLARAFPAMETALWSAIALAGVVTVLLLRHDYHRQIAALVLLFAAGGARQSLAPQDSEIAANNGHSGTLTGIVISEPVVRDDRVQLRVDVEQLFINNDTVPSSGAVLVEADRSSPVAYGDRVRATGALDYPSVGDTFSYADYLGRLGVFSMMRNAGLQVVGEGHGSPLLSTLLELKRIVRDIINGALPEPQAGLLTGILLGDERGIAPELEEAFSRVGASHVIAISGFNMVVISAIVIRIFSAVLGERKSSAAICAVAFIALYSLFVGASPGILRAALMSSLLVIGNQLRRRTFVPTSLAFVALALSLLDPSVLLDIGFQLSFLAVLGLSLFTDPLSERFEALLSRFVPPHMARPINSFLNEPLIVSFAAQIATLPLIVLYFGRLSLMALPVNLLIVPVQSIILLLGMAAVVVYVFVPFIGTLLFWANLVCLSWTISVVRSFAQFEFAEIAVNMDGRLIQCFYVLLIGMVMIRAARPPIWTRLEDFVRESKAAVAVGGAAVITLSLMWAMALSRPDGKLHVWMLDVGHSNALLMQMPGGAQVLIDGGRYPSRLLSAIGDRLPFYDREIEVLVITHPDEWDIAALNPLLDRYEVGAWLYSGHENHGDAFKQIETLLNQSDAEYIKARTGHALAFDDDTVIEVLHPPNEPGISDRLGDEALVLRVRFGQTSFLLTSDLSRAGQKAMIANGVLPVAAVMQIPQHGTARALDADFIDLAQPQVVVLQSDVTNRRGDPDPDTLTQLQGLPLFRTDVHGTIHLVTDGKTLTIHAPRDS